MTSPLERVRRIALDSPESIAITGGAQAVSYRELWSRASAVAVAINQSAEAISQKAEALNQKAEAISQSAEKAGDAIGIAMTRSPEAIEAVLGVLLSGRPYVPLDSALPRLRLQAILEDVRPALVLTAGDRSTAIGHEWRQLDVAEVAIRGGASAFSTADADDLLYVMYTSGSTGLAKGVAMRHGPLANLLEWQLEDPRLGARARTLQYTPLTFDVSFQEIFGCLCTGSTLVTVESGLRRDPASLARVLVENRIERLYLPFVALQQLAEAAIATRRLPRSLRDIVTAGEQLQVTPAIREFFAALDGCALHNHYGPCETHVVTAHTLVGAPENWPSLPPIGKPVSNVEIRVLDANLKRVAPGEIGEIFIGGACHARGYLNQPELTKERFIADPFVETPGALLYRTGDLGRQNDGGEFEWVGRNDHQVKVRGFRVELGEVESVLAEHPSVGQAIVMPRRGLYSTELIAYVTAAADEASLSPASLESIEDWRRIWDRAYETGSVGDDPTLNTTGWNSSYTGEPIAPEHMREWVSGIVERLQKLSPRRVLEIGSGTGLILFRVAPGTEAYVGLDFSAAAIEYVERHLAGSGLGAKAALHRRSAHELGDFEPRSFDLVVLNSVIQHFPSPQYLLEVLGKAARLLRPGGSIFVGDVTPRHHRRAFFAEIERQRLPVDASATEALTKTQHRLELDTELTVDPAFFAVLPGHVAAIEDVEIQLKRGRHRNEMSKYRYDVILHTRDAAQADANDQPWSRIPDDRRNPAELLALAATHHRITGVPNSRLTAVYEDLERLQEAAADHLLCDLASGSPSPQAGIDPEDIYALADASGVDVEIRPSANPACFDLAPTGEHGTSDAAREAHELARFTSDPQLRRRSRELVPLLRSFVADRLPDYMHPASYVMVDRFPTTRSGKVDRSALPAPTRERPPLAQPYVAPTSRLQRSIEAVWRQLLDLSHIGIDDAFYDLGGNSLLILQLAARLSHELGRDVPVVSLFSHPTIRRLATLLEGADEKTVPVAQKRGQRQRGAYTNLQRPRRGKRLT